MKKDKHGNDCSKLIRIHIRTLAAVHWNYVKAVEYAEKLYGSNGIYFDIATQLCLALDAAQQLKFDVIDGTCEWNKANQEHNDLYTLTKMGSLGGIAVFIVGGLKKPDDSTLAGCAGHAVGKPSAVISATGTMYTMAHEIGHVLLGSGFTPGHTEDATNIMVNGTWRIAADSFPTFNAAQIAQIKKSALLTDV